MARSLLLTRIVGVLLLAAASSMSACIIPVAPDFQDPPTRPDSSPNVSNFMPSVFGSTFSITSGKQEFSALVSDPDPGTTLHIRWTVDPYTADTWINTGPDVSSPDPTEPIQNQKVSQVIDCNSINNKSKSNHALELIVADVDFDTSQTSSPEQLVGPGLIVYGYWNINITCPIAPAMPTP